MNGFAWHGNFAGKSLRAAPELEINCKNIPPSHFYGRRHEAADGVNSEGKFVCLIFQFASMLSQNEMGEERGCCSGSDQ